VWAVFSKSIKPQASRGFLKQRLFEAWFKLAAIFLGLVLLWSFVCSLVFTTPAPMLFGNVIAGLATYYIFLRWNQHPLRLRCKGCRGTVLCSTPWICGECGHKNLDVFNFPLIHECESCHYPPKAYRCHHCGELIFLTDDKDKRHFACRVGSEEVPPPNQHALKLKQLQEEKEAKEARLSIAEIEGELSDIRRRVQQNRTTGKTPKEIIQEGVDRIMRWEDAELEIIADVKKRHKGNATAIKRRLAALEKLKQKDLADNT